MPRKRPEKKFKICCAFDTETCNYEEVRDGKREHRAYVVCYQLNDLRNIKIANYEPEKSDDVRIYRTEQEVLDYIEDLIEWGKLHMVVPIICGYNLLFDMQTLLYDLNQTHEMAVTAQTSTNVYTLDLMDEKTRLLRFWDTFHLEQNGLAAMGETAGLAKLKGDWDYSLIRTPETPLTSEEIGYATRDVQVIPAYLRYVLEANPWAREEDLGVRILTKTSLVRRMAENEIGPLEYKGRGGKCTVEKHFLQTCRTEIAKTFYEYGLRKACFRGGFTFTGAAYASTIQQNVCSLDVTSMHHQFINGRYVPVQFVAVPSNVLRHACESILSTSLEHVLKNYHKPLEYGMHARIEFTNIRIRSNSCFERWGVALAPAAKFGAFVASGADFRQSEALRYTERAARMAGWRDSAQGAVFAFGKLVSAERAVMHLSEIELWCMSRVYEWDEYAPILGELTNKFSRPPAYVTLQSHLLFQRKQDMKKVTNTYTEGKPYDGTIGASIPDGIARELKDGTANMAFLKSYYGSTVKGSFNSIYGTQAQDLLRPDYIVQSGDIKIDADTNVCAENYADKLAEVNAPRVWYQYGMRIVGGSRMHLVIALELLDAAFGDAVRVTGGDTDSIKASVDLSVTDLDLTQALAPLADASERAREKCMEWARSQWPDLTAPMDGVGAFDIEACGDATRYPWHYELWNKCRVSIDDSGKSHVTAAGLPRPALLFNIENAIDALYMEKGPAAMPACMGYNVYVDCTISHTLQRTHPEPDARVDARQTDYMGNTAHVDAREAIALYDCGRWLGETSAKTNARDVRHLRERWGRDVDTRIRTLYYDGTLHVDEGMISNAG